jgi:hypothetical protein
MKRIIVLIFLMIFLGASFAYAVEITVTIDSTELWKDTDIFVTPGEWIDIDYLKGEWTWATWHNNGQLYGPGGDYETGYMWDEWITNGHHGALIGYIGIENPYTDPRIIPQNDSRLFMVGNGIEFYSMASGELWLGFNDDYTTNSWADDNEGSVTVKIDPPATNSVPEPSTFLLIGLGLMGVGLLRRRFKK